MKELLELLSKCWASYSYWSSWILRDPSILNFLQVPEWWHWFPVLRICHAIGVLSQSCPCFGFLGSVQHADYLIVMFLFSTCCQRSIMAILWACEHKDSWLDFKEEVKLQDTFRLLRLFHIGKTIWSRTGRPSIAVAIQILEISGINCNCNQVADEHLGCICLHFWRMARFLQDIPDRKAWATAENIPPHT